MLGDDRWVEVTRSAYPHEQRGLQILRRLIPDADPYRAWTNFEFKDSHGRWHEVDALVLGRERLHLVELKYYGGHLRGNDVRWLRDGHRAEDSPLLLTRRKAQRFATKLFDECETWARETGIPRDKIRSVVPWVQESVFVHHEGMVSHLGGTAALGIFGLDEHEDTTHLQGISARILESPRSERRIGGNQSAILERLMARIGLEQRREPRAGNWNLIEPMADGEGWQDWEASHTLVPQRRARIRFQLSGAKTSQAQDEAARRLSDNEFRIMSALHHDGLIRPDDLVDCELGRGLVYPLADDTQRFDLWMAEKGDSLSLDTRLDVIRQTAEALHYAHRNKVVHRGLNPRALWIRERQDGSVKVAVGDWQSAGTAGGTTSGITGITNLHAAAPNVADDPNAAYLAPEGAWSPTADRRRLDLFGLGATAFSILTGDPPASTAIALRERLRAQGGLDVSVELPEASTSLRALVLQATRPVAAERTGTVSAFLEQLARVENEDNASATEQPVDPLDAQPGDLIDGRFQLLRRLGQGSTAVGLLVEDTWIKGNARKVVLKVALNEHAEGRLIDEAAVLRLLRSTHVVRCLEGPIEVGGRAALVLANAGPDTLAEHLRTQSRLSLDLLDRWGTELLSALVDLDKAGIDHRDIKPANLGVRELPRGKSRHLVLFDFSLSRAPATSVTAGTVPYLDPFLGTEQRPRFDPPAERYAAAAVLLEMATGTTPAYGDPSAHPATVSAEATVTPDMFDPTLATSMVEFFRTALARDASHRHGSAADMLARWRAMFAPGGPTGPPESMEELNVQAERATLSTPLAEAGFTTRALSAVEVLGVTTVADLLAVNPVDLNRLPGSADGTRRLVRHHASLWRKKFARQISARSPGDLGPGALPAAVDLAQALMDASGKGRNQSRAATRSMILGLHPDVDPFAPQATLAAHLDPPVTVARVTQIIGKLHDAWASHRETRQILTTADEIVREHVAGSGGVATTDELVERLIGDMEGGPAVNGDERRIAEGLLRIVSDWQRNVARADADQPALAWRRRGGRMVLAAHTVGLLDAADALGRRADSLIADAGGGTDAVIPPDRALIELSAVLAASGAEPSPAFVTGPRLARLSAHLSTRVAASAIGELHHHELAPVLALELALGSVAPSQTLPPREIIDRVAARFPAIPSLPERPRLDQLVHESSLDLVYDESLRTYASQTATLATTGLASRHHTVNAVDPAPVSASGVVGQRLIDSRRSHSFLALGPPSDRLDRLVTVLCRDFGAREVNVTELLLRELRHLVDTAPRRIPWETIEAADAAPPESRDRRGLAQLVARAMPAVLADVDRLLGEQADDSPILLTDAAPLARYDQMDALTRWNDLARPRRQAVWLMVPQVQANHGAVLDGHPVQGSPNQFVRIDHAWLHAQWERWRSEARHREGATV